MTIGMIIYAICIFIVGTWIGLYIDSRENKITIRQAAKINWQLIKESFRSK